MNTEEKVVQLDDYKKNKDRKDLVEFGDRMCRIKLSLEKINKLMEELKNIERR